MTWGCDRRAWFEAPAHERLGHLQADVAGTDDDDVLDRRPPRPGAGAAAPPRRGCARRARTRQPGHGRDDGWAPVASSSRRRAPRLCPGREVADPLTVRFAGVDADRLGAHADGDARGAELLGRAHDEVLGVVDSPDVVGDAAHRVGGVRAPLETTMSDVGRACGRGGRAHPAASPPTTTSRVAPATGRRRGGRRSGSCPPCPPGSPDTITMRSPRCSPAAVDETRSAAPSGRAAASFIGTSAASVPHMSAVRRRVLSFGVRPSSGMSRAVLAHELDRRARDRVHDERGGADVLGDLARPPRDDPARSRSARLRPAGTGCTRRGGLGDLDDARHRPDRLDRVAPGGGLARTASARRCRRTPRSRRRWPRPGWAGAS
jgi:hypothetical protein